MLRPCTGAPSAPRYVYQSDLSPWNGKWPAIGTRTSSSGLRLTSPKRPNESASLSTATKPTKLMPAEGGQLGSVIFTGGCSTRPLSEPRTATSGAVMRTPAFAEKVKPRSGSVPTAAERPKDDSPATGLKLCAPFGVHSSCRATGSVTPCTDS